MRVVRSVVVLAVGSVVLLAAGTARAQWQIDSRDGKANIKVGLLAQPQLELLDTPDGSGRSKNVFLRRIRIMFGGKLSDRWTFFVETDSPNLGKTTGDRTTNPSGAKDAGNAYIQDAYFTYSQGDAIKVDAGMILVPLGHNHNQSAATLLAPDYGPCSFLEGVALGSRLGRDYGAQLRGYPVRQHVEYRLGVFQGARGVEARNGPRVAGRAVWYPFAADTGFFYGGTFHAARRVVGVGAGFDAQGDYRSYAADVFVEQPLDGGRRGLTAQFNWTRHDGGTFVPGLPPQEAIVAEAAFHLLKWKVSPLAQYARRTFDNRLTPTQASWQVGVAYWMAGHQRNVKATVGRQHVERQADRTQVVVQLQLFYF